MAGEIPEIPGQLVPADIAYNLRRLVGEITGTNRTTFPGAQPVSFTASESVSQLLAHNYLVCEKSDGVRVLVLMLATDKGPQTFFITRKNEYFFAPNLAFPTPGDSSRFHHNTLIDAELVIDVMPDGSRVRKLLAFDALVVFGANCMQRDLEKRLGFLRDHIVGPFRAARRHDNPKAARLVPVVAEVKLFERSYGVQKVYDQIIPRLYHKSDGLIFTAVKAPYMPGTCNTIVKWKPAGENSIDFKIRVTRNSSNAPELQLHQWLGGDNYELFGIMAVRPDDWATHFADLARLDGRIAETIYDPEYSPPAVWRFLRFRDDKPHGNHASVIQRIIASIGDTMDLDELVNVMVQVRDNWKSRNPGS